MTNIKIRNGMFPILRPVIDSEHNTLCIIYNGERLPIELDDGDNYTIAELLEGINESLESEEIPIEINEDDEGHIIINTSS